MLRIIWTQIQYDILRSHKSQHDIHQWAGWASWHDWRTRQLRAFLHQVRGDRPKSMVDGNHIEVNCKRTSKFNPPELFSGAITNGDDISHAPELRKHMGHPPQRLSYYGNETQLHGGIPFFYNFPQRHFSKELPFQSIN